MQLKEIIDVSRKTIAKKILGNMNFLEKLPKK